MVFGGNHGSPQHVLLDAERLLAALAWEMSGYGSLPLGGTVGTSAARSHRNLAVQIAAGLVGVCVVLGVAVTVSRSGAQPVSLMSLDAPEPVMGFDPNPKQDNKNGHVTLAEQVFHAKQSQLTNSQLKQLQAMTCGVGSCSAGGGCDSKAFLSCMKMDPQERSDFVLSKMPHLKLMDGYVATLPGPEVRRTLSCLTHTFHMDVFFLNIFIKVYSHWMSSVLSGMGNTEIKAHQTTCRAFERITKQHCSSTVV
jgi:hypothetical protein